MIYHVVYFCKKNNPISIYDILYLYIIEHGNYTILDSEFVCIYSNLSII